jgi:hypothetical protein
MRAVLATLRQGIKSPEHKEFVKLLRRRKARKKK